MISRD